MADDKISKTYIRPDNTAVLTCPHCGQQKVILVDSFKDHKYKLKVKCVCQNVFVVVLEFRNKVRKKTRLGGTYINHSQNNAKGFLVITNISVTGLGFISQDEMKFKEGDRLTIEFTLDDERKTEIGKEAIVMYSRQESVGCKFQEPEDPFGSPLGNYVMADFK